jgi:hypothetical protein
MGHRQSCWTAFEKRNGTKVWLIYISSLALTCICRRVMVKPPLTSVWVQSVRVKEVFQSLPHCALLVCTFQGTKCYDFKNIFTKMANICVFKTQNAATLVKNELRHWVSTKYLFFPENRLKTPKIVVVSLILPRCREVYLLLYVY